MDALTIGEILSIEYGLIFLIEERESLLKSLPPDLAENTTRQLNSAKSALKKIRETKWTLSQN